MLPLLEGVLLLLLLPCLGVGVHFLIYVAVSSFKEVGEQQPRAPAHPLPHDSVDVHQRLFDGHEEGRQHIRVDEAEGGDEEEADEDVIGDNETNCRRREPPCSGRGVGAVVAVAGVGRQDAARSPSSSSAREERRLK